MKKVAEKIENFIDKYGEYLVAASIALNPGSIQRNDFFNLKK